MGRIFGIFLIVVCIVPDSQQDDNELRLIKDLFFRGYNKNVRPVEDKSMPVEVKFGIAYTQVVDLIEKDQVLISNIWVRMNWNNHLLRWNASEYGGIDKLNISPTLMWLPDIVLHNNAEENVPAGTLYQFKTKVQLFNDGLCVWYAPTIIQSGCNIDITYFPFDDQLCELKFGSWTYNGLEVNIVQMLDQADLKFYMKSSEFQLISAKAKRNVNTFSCCPEPYPTLSFYIHLRRDPGFYLFNIIIPCLVLTGLSVMTFMLPPEFGERITLVIESFFAMSVIILNISDQIPVTSDATPILMSMLLIGMFQIGGCLIANTVSLNLYKDCEMPQWVRVFILHYLARCLCIKIEESGSEVEIPKAINFKLDDIEKRQSKLLGARMYRVNNCYSELSSTPNVNVLDQKKPYDTFDSPQFSKIADGFRELGRHSLRNTCSARDREFWSFYCIVMDRVFFIIFLLMFIFSFWKIFGEVPSHYRFPF
ncbi:neuronal acetylcholine receptor subunit alpha-2 isoform X3 [Nematostella vectensis]|uniref:neuronal acetylcholine receptor subunit alpha-2 isoform X3 n=1 Tax=Nematostella vectensis TaxID=45351 RepID=UPI00139019AC|nr:neuronal acetylcholine receptor subunit alpha-2 isoform X3 [Nematostella vectensis]